LLVEVGDGRKPSLGVDVHIAIQHPSACWAGSARRSP
jgi:hypothetical protein